MVLLEGVRWLIAWLCLSLPPLAIEVGLRCKEHACAGEDQTGPHGGDDQSSPDTEPVCWIEVLQPVLVGHYTWVIVPRQAPSRSQITLAVGVTV